MVSHHAAVAWDILRISLTDVAQQVSKAAQRAKTTVKEKKQNQHENDLNTRQGLHKLMRKSFNMMAIAAVVGLVTMVLNLEVLTRQFIHSGSQTYEATVAIKVIKCIMSISVVFQAGLASPAGASATGLASPWAHAVRAHSHWQRLSQSSSPRSNVYQVQCLSETIHDHAGRRELHAQSSP